MNTKLQITIKQINSYWSTNSKYIISKYHLFYNVWF